MLRGVYDDRPRPTTVRLIASPTPSRNQVQTGALYAPMPPVVYVVGCPSGRLEVLYAWLLAEGILQEGRGGRVRWAHAHVFVVQCGDQVQSPESHTQCETAAATLFMDYLRKLSGGRAISLLGASELSHLAAPPASSLMTRRTKQRSSSTFTPRAVMERIWRLRPAILRINNLVFSYDGVHRAQERMPAAPHTSMRTAATSTATATATHHYAYAALDRLIRDTDHMLETPYIRDTWMLRHTDQRKFTLPSTSTAPPACLPDGAVDVMLCPRQEAADKVATTALIRAYRGGRMPRADITPRGVVQYPLHHDDTYFVAVPGMCATPASAAQRYGGSKSVDHSTEDSRRRIPWVRFTATSVHNDEWMFDQVELSEFSPAQSPQSSPPFPFAAALDFGHC